MKIQRTTINKEDVVHIYVSKNELEDNTINTRIDEIKQENKNVVIFVSGQENIRNALQYIINKQAIQRA